MTPKEKAEELIGKYFDTFVNDEDEHYSGTAWRISKQCAFIAVNEIIKSRDDDGHFDDTLSSTGSEYYTPHPMYLTYWVQVKQ